MPSMTGELEVARTPTEKERSRLPLLLVRRCDFFPQIRMVYNHDANSDNGEFVFGISIFAFSKVSLIPMIEQEEPAKFAFIGSIRNRREQLHLPMLDIDQLQDQANGPISDLAEKAQRLLRIKWDLDPLKDSLQARSVNILEQLSVFSRTEIETMLQNIVALQLTEGCNGNCAFCAFGKKDGVTEKYSFDSLRAFFETYASILSNRPFLFYWDSDPFDYRDGPHSFVDVFSIYGQMSSPDNYHYVSTALPRGSELDFLNFMFYIAANRVMKDEDGKPHIHLRFSLAQHNIQRVEAVINKLTQALATEGYGPQDIDQLYNEVFSTVDRSDDNLLLPIGPFIHRADDIRDTYSTLCRDGAVIAPRSCSAVMMTAPTIYEPSGQKSVPLVPGQAETQIPTYVREEYYATFRFGETSLVVRTKRRQTMLNPITHPDGNEYSLPDEFEDVSLKLSREVASMSRLIMDFSKIAWVEVQSTDPLQAKTVYLRVATETFKERTRHTQELLSRAEQHCGSGATAGENLEKLQHYIFLTKVHIAKMGFLASQVEKGLPMLIVSIMANILRQVGRNEIDKLPKIFDGLTILGQTVREEEIDVHRINRAVLKSFFRKKFSQAHTSDLDVPNTIPDWFSELVSVYGR